jgi:hypothetical protein
MPRPLVVPADLNLFLYFATLSFTIQSSFFLVFVFRKMHKADRVPFTKRFVVSIMRCQWAPPRLFVFSLRHRQMQRRWSLIEVTKRNR